jgi:oxygen-dependent protoporphyrinogen oxidase
MNERRVAVIGAGITGLTAAYRLQSRGIHVEVFEASERVGGSIRTIDIGDARVDIGPSGILASRESVIKLVDDLKLSGAWLEACPDSNRRYIYYQGTLNEVPTSPPRLLLSSWLPLSAKWKILTEFFRTPRRGGPLESLHDLVERRFGSFVAEVMVDSMVSGIHAAPARTLEAQAAFPILPAYESEHGSILRGLIRAMKSRRHLLPERTPQLKGMLNLREGLEMLPKALESHIEPIHLNTPVRSLEQRGEHDWVVDSPLGLRPYSDVLLTLPAPQAADCLSKAKPELSQELAKVDYTPLGNVILYFDSPVQTPQGFGYLSPGVENRPMLGCLFLNRIFPELVPSSCTVLRAFVGGQRAKEELMLDDAALVEMTLKELEIVLEQPLPKPTSSHVLRWPQSLPFYNKGTCQRWETLEAMVSKAPGLQLGGNWLYGASVADCVSRGDYLATQIRDS